MLSEMDLTITKPIVTRYQLTIPMTVFDQLPPLDHRQLMCFIDANITMNLFAEWVVQSRGRYELIRALSQGPILTLQRIGELQLRAFGYVIPKPSQVLEFLSDEPSLWPLVTEARSKIREHFPDAQLILEVKADREDHTEQLVIFIQTDLPAEEAFYRLDLLDDAWWLDASPIAGQMCIHIEFL